MAKAKQYKIVVHPAGRSYEYSKEGTLEELKAFFGMTKDLYLNAGDYWHSKTVRIAQPKTIKGLMSALAKESHIRFSCCYDCTTYDLITL
jgi:hypothetical protein